MKKFLPILMLMFISFSGMLLAQTYPLVTIEDIQYVSESTLLNSGDSIGVYHGDTVRVQGIVMVRPVVDPDTDRRRIFAAANRWMIYMVDTSGHQYDFFDGIIPIQHDTTGDNQNTFFDLVDTADVVEFTVVVEEYYTTTQAALLLNPVTEVNLVGNVGNRPDPVEVDISEFVDDQGNWNPLTEKYEGQYVIVRNFFTSDRSLSDGTFRINDGQGNSILMYDQSGFFTLRSHSLGDLYPYEPPQDGSNISYIRGFIQTHSDLGIRIAPAYPGDIGPVVESPPSISSIRRDSSEVGPNQPVEISARITDIDGTVQEGRVYYRIDGGQRMMLPMTFSPSDTLYKGTIPGVNSDSSLVDFYIWAKDNQDLVSINPVDTLTDNYFYLVLNRPVTIRDVQYSPLGGGNSAYTNYEVTLNGIVTSDTSDIRGYGSSSSVRNYMQDGEGPWSGIQINFGEPLGTELQALLRRGDDLTVTGTIEDGYDAFYVTRINNVTAYTINSSGNPLPAPYIVTTGEIGEFGGGEVLKEQWESVYIAYQNPEITNINADGGSNYGEMFVSDGSGDTRVELEDGNNSFHNGSGSPGTILIQQGATFDELRGILYYSFSNYKLLPRKDDDFVNYTNVIDDNQLPSNYALDQNYPNPFNPATTIQYAIPEAGIVNISIYNILGQKVKTVLDNSSQSAGSYKIVFDASQLPSGIYFYRIEVNDFVQVKKMILMK